MIKFIHPELLITALTHRSAINEKKGSRESNERLEFLGDAVLELVVSAYLFRRFPGLNEGELTAKRAQIVQTKTLAAAAKNFGLGGQIIMSKGEVKAGGEDNPSILANTFEAVTGALYLDQGLTVVQNFIAAQLLTRLDSLFPQAKVTDYKSRLQELFQKRYKTAPKYRLIRAFGPEHKKTFIVKVYLKGQAQGLGQGLTKQESEQQAARQALEKIRHIC